MLVAVASAPVVIYTGIGGYQASQYTTAYTEAETADIATTLELSTQITENTTEPELETVLAESGFVESTDPSDQWYDGRIEGTNYPQRLWRSPTGVAEIRSKYPDPGWNQDLDYSGEVDNQVRINIQAKFNEPGAYEWLQQQDLVYSYDKKYWLNVWNGNFVPRDEHHFLGGGPYQRPVVR